MTPPRWWPDGIVARIAFVLFLILTAGAIVYWWVYGDRDQEETRQRVGLTVAGRLVAVTELIDRSSNRETLIVIDAVSSPRFRIAVDYGQQPDPYDERNASSFPTLIQRIVALELGRSGLPIADLKMFEYEREALTPRRHDKRPWLKTDFSLGADRRLTFDLAIPPTRPSPAARMIGLSILCLVIFGLMVWVAHRETKPLRRFAAAADRLGLDVDAPPLEEVGSRELRSAIGAFNRMQSRLQRFLSDRTQMLAAISHDLRTPLTRLRLRAEFIKGEEQQRKAIADIEEMQAMISETLAFARNDALAEERESTNVAEMLDTICRNHIDSGNDAAYAGPDEVLYPCQAVSMHRALTNLVDNAVRYGDSADVSLQVGVEQLIICIDDRGPGIQTEQREQVFSPFYRIESSRNRETGGVGLGLSLARDTIRRHGGDIDVEDRHPPPGCRMKVRLPLVQNR
ncbi:MAG: ATP-binding protein [Pseudomonadota bacterium]